MSKQPKRQKYDSIKAVLDAMLASGYTFSLRLSHDAQGERVIATSSGKHQIYITKYGTGAGLYFYQTDSFMQSKRIRWDGARRLLLAAGCELVQWGVNVGEGCVRFDPADKKQLAAVLDVLNG